MTYIYEEAPAPVITSDPRPILIDQGERTATRKAEVEALIRANCTREHESAWRKFAKSILV